MERVHAASGAAVIPWDPRWIPAIADIALGSLGERYELSLYESIGRAWPDGQVVTALAGEPVGFLAAVVPQPGVARILMLAVRGRFRSQGLGSTLLREFLDRAARAGYRQVTLEVRRSNTRAIGFYQRWGFSITGVIPNYYSDGEEGYVMWRLL